MVPLFVLAGVLVVAGCALASYCAPYRRNRRFLLATINSLAVATLGVVLLIIGVVRVLR